MGKWKEQNWDKWNWKRRILHVVAVFFSLLTVLIMSVLFVLFVNWITGLNTLFENIIRNLLNLPV